jgi:membrane protease YdiL (CAAX protease family)
MRALPATLLLLYLLALAWLVRKDIPDYAAFKLLVSTTDRQRRFRVWIAKAFLFFAGGALIALALLGRWRALYTLPSEFENLAHTIRSTATPHALLSAGFLGGLLGGVLASIAIGALAKKTLGARKNSTLVAGDVQPLMPRNSAEIAHSLLFAANAGFSEELFFRLLLPLLIAIVLGNALAAFLAAAVIFGLVHIYRGWVGVVATTVLALLHAALYLGTGSIWIAIVAHALLDVITLVVRPTLARLVATR